ncbi:hypothetical protein CYLTODRAFT_228753 [Cylindrobasidium torrendii FP15055 ss-10]|uniref:Uncharacterized protein n=1 Tax=Cylindrobasidium torrendii FP15055 ss-10 TaxID=1314674 RepID=A0A0D7BFX9_9AGAR|nr:hypothetical protein CYLTODRAFT_228753 [Cylindrobasidium torrendii FP15055 ss-10]
MVNDLTASNEQFPDYRNELEFAVPAPFTHSEGPEHVSQSSDNVHSETPDEAVEFNNVEEPRVGDSFQGTPSLEGVDDLIKTEWHPASGKPIEVVSFSEYRATTIDKAPPVAIDEALGPFETELDALFCEWMLDANISEEQGNQLIGIVHGFVREARAPQVKTWKDWKSTMDAATALTTPFKKTTFTMPFAGDELEYTVISRDIVQDVLLVLDNPNLQPLLEVWSRRTFKSHDGGKTWERFITQPWTADFWWEIDTLFPGRYDFPIRILIYSDKTRLSSFGNVQGWPVYWRLLHLDSNIRNSRGIGGGRVGAFLPQFHEEQKYKKMDGWVDYKRAVYMRAYSIILESVRQHASTGVARRLKYIDENYLTLFIMIMIISADLDEQSSFALTRGFNSKAPCPVCLVDSDSLLEDGPFSPRTTEHARALYNWAKTPGLNKGVIEAEFKKYGMRNIENPMWINLPHLDVFRALSVCTMHTNAGGNWPHIRDETIDYIIQMAVFPRWKGLNHFGHWLSKSLNDATKNEDMSIQAMYCLHTTLTPERRHGYLLLRALRAYHELNAYGNLTVHTTTTIQMGLAAHSRYLTRLKELQTQYPHEKAWGFPKSHTPLHLFADIVAKGCQVSFSTKPSEQMHASLKATYQHRSNFKNVDTQLALYESYHDAMLIVRHNIEMNKAATPSKPKDEFDDEGQSHESTGQNRKKRRRPRRVETSTQSTAATVHAHVCGAGGKHTVAWMEARSADDKAYHDFGRRLNEFLADYLSEHRDDAIAQGVAEPVFHGLRPSSPIHRYAELRVAYPSEVDWDLHTDLLRSNPWFNHNVRYDCVLVDDPSGGPPFFARLVSVFRCFPYEGSSFSVVAALVHPYTQPLEHNERKKKLDLDLRFYRVRSRPRQQTMFISVAHIARGALLAEDHMGQPPIVLSGWKPDFSRIQDYLVVDLVDEDMFIRMQSLDYVGRRPGLCDDLF